MVTVGVRQFSLFLSVSVFSLGHRPVYNIMWFNSPSSRRTNYERSWATRKNIANPITGSYSNLNLSRYYNHFYIMYSNRPVFRFYTFLRLFFLLFSREIVINIISHSHLQSINIIRKSFNLHFRPLTFPTHGRKRHSFWYFKLIFKTTLKSNHVLNINISKIILISALFFLFLTVYYIFQFKMLN